MKDLTTLPKNLPAKAIHIALIHASHLRWNLCLAKLNYPKSMCFDQDRPQTDNSFIVPPGKARPAQAIQSNLLMFYRHPFSIFSQALIFKETRTHQVDSRLSHFFSKFNHITRYRFDPHSPQSTTTEIKKYRSLIIAYLQDKSVLRLSLNFKNALMQRLDGFQGLNFLRSIHSFFSQSPRSKIPDKHIDILWSLIMPASLLGASAYHDLLVAQKGGC